MPDSRKTQSDASNLAAVMDQLLAKLSSFVAWRRNFTIVSSVFVLLLAFGIFNDSRVQNCDEAAAEQRAHLTIRSTVIEEQLWNQIDNLIRHPAGDSPAERAKGRQELFGYIRSFRENEDKVIREPLRVCSWF